VVAVVLDGERVPVPLFGELGVVGPAAEQGGEVGGGFLGEARGGAVDLALRVPAMPSALVAATLITTSKESCPARRSRQHRIAASN
jgi:hypothetical protein